MGAITVTATVRDSTGATGTATATAQIADDPGAVRAAQLRPAGPCWPGDLGGKYVGVYSAEEYTTPRRRVATLAVAAGGVYRDLIIDDLVLPPATSSAGFFDMVNCEIKGTSTAPTSPQGLVKLFNGTTHPIARLTDCLLSPTTASKFWNGVHGWGAELERCEVERCVDGVGVFGREGGTTAAAKAGDVKLRVRRTWFHDGAYFLAGVGGETVSDGTHTDVGWQIAGGRGWVFEYCDVAGFIGPEFGKPGGLTHYDTRHATSCVMVVPDDYDIGPGRVVGCRFAGGAVCINVIRYKRNTDGTVRYQVLDLGEWYGNTFVKGSTRTGGGNAAIMVPMVKNAAGVWTYAGPPCDWGSGLTPGSTNPPNLWDDGTPVAFSNGGAP